MTSGHDFVAGPVLLKHVFEPSAEIVRVGARNLAPDVLQDPDSSAPKGS